MFLKKKYKKASEAIDAGLEFVKNIYGDSINVFNARSMWVDDRHTFYYCDELYDTMYCYSHKKDIDGSVGNGYRMPKPSNLNLTVEQLREDKYSRLEHIFFAKGRRFEYEGESIYFEY